MSRFFQTTEDEKIETKQKTKIIEEQEQSASKALSKKEQKLSELRNKTEELIKNDKNFEKLFKKFMNELGKYTSAFEGKNLPVFLTDFFENKKIADSKQMKSQVKRFLDDFTKQEEEVVVRKKEEKQNVKNMESILAIEDDSEKEREILSLVGGLSADGNSSIENAEALCEGYLALFGIYSRKKACGKMIKILLKISKFFSFDIGFIRIVKKNIDAYLGKIYDLMHEDDYQDYSKLLESVKPFNETIFKKRFLEMEFFKLQKCVSNDDPQFTLLYLVRSNSWEASRRYFNEHRTIYDDSKASSLILYEFAIYSARNSDFKLAFEILSFDSLLNAAFLNLKTEVSALCVILSHSIIENKLFRAFLDEFKEFDSNYLVLPSASPIMEIYRAFYFLNCFDHKNAAEIIFRITGFDCEESLKKASKELLNSNYYNINK